jgi:hypothetical protein
MGTETSRRRGGRASFLAVGSTARALAGCGLAALVLAGCGGSSGGASQGGASQTGTGAAVPTGTGAAGQTGTGAAAQTGSFSWLHPQRPPAGWRVVRIANGTELAYPPSWKPEHGDRGTATAALMKSDGSFLGYLNLTPRQGDETLSDWSSFRPDHNRDEGDRAVTRLAAATGLHFLGGTGSCIKDAYTTQLGSRFIEIACLVAGAHAQSVIVGAAPPDEWARASATIERAIAGVQT